MSINPVEINTATLMAFSSPTREDADTNVITLELSAAAEKIYGKLENSKRVSRTSVLETALLADKIPSIKEINYILAYFGFPGLYLSAYDKEVCKRNAVIISVFEYFSENPETCGAKRIKTLNKALSQFSLKEFSLKNEYSKSGVEIEETLDARCVSRIKYVDTVARHNSITDIFESFVEKTFLEITVDNIAKAKKLITDALASEGISEAAANKLFAEGPLTLTRETVIAFAIFTGCDTYELSRLLIESNLPMLCDKTNDKKTIERIKS